MDSNTPVKSIKKYCRYDCCAGNMTSWRLCSRPTCPLYPYRMGKRPKKVVLGYDIDTKNGGIVAESQSLRLTETN